jgi:hypothetical protein
VFNVAVIFLVVAAGTHLLALSMFCVRHIPHRRRAEEEDCDLTAPFQVLCQYSSTNSPAQLSPGSVWFVALWRSVPGAFVTEAPLPYLRQAGLGPMENWISHVVSTASLHHLYTFP